MKLRHHTHLTQLTQSVTTPVILRQYLLAVNISGVLVNITLILYIRHSLQYVSVLNVRHFRAKNLQDNLEELKL
jgi:hypothetical protein